MGRSSVEFGCITQLVYILNTKGLNSALLSPHIGWPLLRRNPLDLTDMNDTQNLSFSSELNRRKFLKGGSAATLLGMLGGVELFAQTNTAPTSPGAAAKKVKIGLIGLGPWGRELLTTLARLPEAQVVAICDNYKAMANRSASLAPGATQVPDYKALLSDKSVTAVIVATPTHLHKQIVLDALSAGKHVYCEAPLAHTIDDAREIAAAARASKHLVFQAGLQWRSDKLRHFMIPFIRSGAVGQFVMGRAQWHKKQSWRSSSPNPEREKVMNWRLVKETSIGLIGEQGIHQLDQACWFVDSVPTAVSGFGSTILWKDGREVPDTVQAVIQFPGGFNLIYHATLANSFDANYEIFHGTDAAVMLREASAWMFKEVDSPLLGWEVYAKKDVFYKETGIVLRPDASKSPPTSQQQAQEDAIKTAPLYLALTNFLRNASDVTERAQDLTETLGEADPEELAKVQRRPAAGYKEGFIATMLAIKANEAILQGQKLEIKPNLYEIAS